MKDLSFALVVISIVMALAISGIYEDKNEQAMATVAANNLCDYKHGGSEIIIDCEGARKLKQ